MIFLRLFYEFFKVGLFSVGGGLATIPFLTDMGSRTGWFSAADLANMIAISESTPGPMGVNMATYVGFRTGSLAGGPIGGIFGGVIATLGLIAPSILVILIIARVLQRFRQSKVVDAVFYGLRPASTALIAAALVQVCHIALVAAAPVLTQPLSWFNWPSVALAVVVFLAMREKHLKSLHPIVFIALAAAAGIVFQM